MLVSLGVNSRLGPYEILAPLGAGGMGEVYRARDPRLGREVAVKVLREDLSSQADGRARFAIEAKAIAALNHPNIVSIFDFGAVDGVDYMVSELIDGESLRSLVKRGPVPVRKLLDIAVQIADGLAAAHALGIAHRDLKPENIMVTADGRVKILDFGIARWVDQPRGPLRADDSTLTVHRTAPGTILGTATYMSPEQARGEAVDYRSDQFSFGLIVYELTSGKPPFERASTIETLAAIVRDEPPPIDAKLPAPLLWIVDRCLAKDPPQRYDSTRDLYSELRAVRDHLSDAYVSAALPPPAAGTIKRSRMLAVAAILPWILLATAIVILFSRDAGQNLTNDRYTPFSMRPEGQYAPVWSPDGKAVAYTGIVQGTPRILVRYRNSPLATTLDAGLGWARPVRWSRDSNRIFFVGPANDASNGDGAALYSVAVVGGEPERIIEIPRYPNASLDISPDNQALAVSVYGRLNGAKATVLISSPLGSPLRQYEPDPFASNHFYSHPRLKFSPDGKHLLLIRSPDGRKEEAWLLPYPPSRQTPRRTLEALPDQRFTRDFSWMPDSRHIALSMDFRGGRHEGHLWIADTMSKRAYQITGGTSSENDLAVSPDGESIIYSAVSNDLNIVSVSLAGATASKLIATDRNESMPSWSGKNAELAYVTDRNGPPEIWMKAHDGTERPLVTQKDFGVSPTLLLANPSLSPDGQRIVFTRQSGEGRIRNWIMSLSGGAPQPLDNSGNDAEYSGSWSPKANRFVYLAVNGSSTSLVIAKIGSTEKPVVIRKGVAAKLPDWSPAGNGITFEDDRDGWDVLAPDGKNLRHLGKIPTDYLVFAKNGKALFGLRPERDKSVLFSIDLATLRMKTIGELDKDMAPRSDFYPGIRFSLAPDGDSIAYTTEQDKSNLWVLQGFRQPGSLSRLGL
jgi:serine/threonine protein kinase/Tol biopolymer transport system component